MKKAIIIILLTLMLVLTPVMAMEDNIDITDADVGGDTYFENQAELSLWDKFLLGISSKSLTVVNGATCSLYPDRNMEYTPSTSSLCYTNTLHDGVAWQIFDMGSSGNEWNYIGEKNIPQGDKQCFSVTPGNRYYLQWYYCDGGVERTCTDSDGGIISNTFGYVQGTNDGQTYKIYDSCNSFNSLQERYCVDDSVVSKPIDCNCDDGKCVAYETDPDTDVPVVPGDTDSEDDESQDESNDKFALWQYITLGIGVLLLVFVGWRILK